MGFSPIPMVTPSFSPSPIPLLQLPQRVYSMPDTTLSAGETGMNKTDVAHALLAILFYSFVHATNID